MRRAKQQSVRKQTRKEQSDGWEQWGGYMAAKKAKLDKQFNLEKPNDSSPVQTSDDLPQIFRGVSVYINGYTDPPEPELRSIFTRHGGSYTSYLTANVTFVIASNLPMGKKKLLAAKTVKADWIVDSAKAGVKLDHRNYMLYNLNQENKQGTLTQFVKTTSFENGLSGDIIDPNLDSKSCNDVERLDTPILKTKIPTCVEQGRTNGKQYHLVKLSSSSENSPDSEGNFTRMVPGPSLPSASVGDDSMELSENSNQDNSIRHPTQHSVTNRLKTAGEDGFLEDFYNSSRLHLISTMKKEVQQMVTEWRKDSTREFPLALDYADSLPLVIDPSSQDNLSSPTGQVVFHVDLDCFFVAVGLLTRPHLRGKPVVVTHSKGSGKNDSKSDISCASYEARAKGVKAAMWLHQAKKLCPEVEVIPYDFDEYKRVSKLFFETVAKLTLEMEPISIDEMVLNVTDIVRNTNSSPLALAAFLRNAIMSEAKVNASIGIGRNKLSAKLATRVAKDNHAGQHYMNDVELKDYIRGQPVRKLPGIGWATADRLSTQFHVETGAQLEALSLDELKRAFGVKTGDKLYSICRGIDNDIVHCDSTNAKSLSAGCSWGVRFSNNLELEKFIRDLASEIALRAGKTKCYGAKLSLSLWVVRKGYLQVQVKPGGHGVVDIFSKTKKLLQHTRETPIISKTALELTRSITQNSIPPDHIRGVSIAMDELKYESDMSAKEKKSIQTTLFAAMPNIRQLGNELKAEGHTTSLSPPVQNLQTGVESAHGSTAESNSSPEIPVFDQASPQGYGTNSATTNSDNFYSENSQLMIASETCNTPSSLVDQDSAGKLQSPEDMEGEEEVDIFTGETVIATPEKHDDVDIHTNDSPPKSVPPLDALKSKGSDIVAKPNYQTNISERIATRNINSSSKSGARETKSTGVTNKLPRTTSIEIINEFDPAVQQRILESCKKNIIRLPSMNGVSEIGEVQKLIQKGIKGRMPVEDDVISLETYFRDLSSGPHPFLKQSCDSLIFLRKLQVSLRQGKVREAAAWTKVFDKITLQMEAAIEEKFGGRIEYKI